MLPQVFTVSPQRVHVGSVSPPSLIVRIGPDSTSLSLTHNLSVLDLNDHMHMSRAVLVT